MLNELDKEFKSRYSNFINGYGHNIYVKSEKAENLVIASIKTFNE